MKKIFVFLLISVVGLTVVAQKKKELTTPVRLNYCLPKVAYHVEVTMECVRYIPGPYHAYAEKELKLRPEITSSRELWRIKKMEIKPQYLPDEKAIYSITATMDYTPITLALSAEGFIAGVSSVFKGEAYNELKEKAFINDVSYHQKSEINIVDLNTYNHLKEVLDTNYTYQEIDGEMKKIWDPIVRYVHKTEADNVREAVNEIFRIRSERVKLLSAENEVPDGKSLEIILAEFDKMEANYLSLFMGKTETREIKRMFSAVPLKSNTPIVLFRFSDEAGIVDLKNVSAQAFSLQITDLVIPTSPSEFASEDNHAIHYRVPAVGNLQLLKGKEVFTSMHTIVPQLGEIKKIPLEVITNERLSLEFYPQYGALKGIQNK